MADERNAGLAGRIGADQMPGVPGAGGVREILRHGAGNAGGIVDSSQSGARSLLVVLVMAVLCMAMTVDVAVGIAAGMVVGVAKRMAVQVSTALTRRAELRRQGGQDAAIRRSTMSQSMDGAGEPGAEVHAGQALVHVIVGRAVDVAIGVSMAVALASSTRRGSGVVALVGSRAVDAAEALARASHVLAGTVIAPAGGARDAEAISVKSGGRDGVQRSKSHVVAAAVPLVDVAVAGVAMIATTWAMDRVATAAVTIIVAIDGAEGSTGAVPIARAREARTEAGLDGTIMHNELHLTSIIMVDGRVANEWSRRA